MNITNQNDGTFKITGDWDLQSKKLKEKYSELTDNDLKYEAGRLNELLTRMESRLNKKRDEVIKIIRNGLGEKAPA